jgi:hypothetical protein
MHPPRDLRICSTAPPNKYINKLLNETITFERLQRKPLTVWFLMVATRILRTCGEASKEVVAVEYISKLIGVAI